MSAEQKRGGILGILITIAVLFTLFMMVSVYIFKSLQGAKDTAELNIKDLNKGPIGVIYVNGVIMDSDKLIRKLLTAEEDKSIEAIILRIDSPGGAVGPTQEIYEEIVRIDKKKPVYASFGSVAASGGYYLGAATRKIYASPGTLTGSIGVIMQFADMSKLYEWAKVNPEVVKSGKFKDIGSPARPMRDEERAYLENMVADVHKQFLRDIMKRRSGKVKDIDKHAQGQIFSGEDAHKWGFVDAIGGLWVAGREIHKELKLEAAFGLREIKEKKKFDWFEALQNVDAAVNNVKTFFSRQSNAPSPYFLYQ